jgi:hypothetical protein
MGEHLTESTAEAELSARIIRCGCGAPASHAGQVCPQGQIEDVGVVSRSRAGRKVLDFIGKKLSNKEK